MSKNRFHTFRNAPIRPLKTSRDGKQRRATRPAELRRGGYCHLPHGQSPSLPSIYSQRWGLSLFQKVDGTWHRWLWHSVFGLVAINALFPSNARAYLDPEVGSLFLQYLIGICVGLLLLVRISAKPLVRFCRNFLSLISKCFRGDRAKL